MKRGPHKRENKSLARKELLKVVKNVFGEIKLPKSTMRGKPSTISLTDSLMSAFAMFGLKAPSLLSFDQDRRKDTVYENLKTLYVIKKVPCDTYIREVLDEVNSRSIRGTFTGVLHVAQRGKVLERFRFIDNNYLIAIDGTNVFKSEKVQCNNCCEKKHRDGSISYHHQILGGVLIHPDSRQVIPFCPEPKGLVPIKQDGKTKNDCELNAAYRFLKDFKNEHRQLKDTFTCDALYANAPFIHMLKKQHLDYIIVVKKGAHKTLFEWIEGIELKEYELVVGSTTYSFRFINNIPLNDSKDAPSVNFLQCKEIKLNGEKKEENNFSWVTSHHITEENIFKLMRGGRTKWKVENETFNTLKNQGYHFEHNFGHGKKNLHTVFAFLMMLAFLIDQIAEIADGLFQRALQKLISRRSLWEKMRGFFYTVLINSWEGLFNAIALEYSCLMTVPDTS